MSDGHSLIELGETIACLTKRLQQACDDEGISSPSVNDVNAASRKSLLETDASAAFELAQALRELEVLAQSPRLSLGILALATLDASILGVIAEFQIASLVPLNGSISYGELSQKTGLDEGRLVRVIRYAVVNFIFREEPVGHVRHTYLSAHLARSPNFNIFVQTVSHVFSLTNAALPLAFRRWPNTAVQTETAHNVAQQTELSFYRWMDANPSMRDMFHKGMVGVSQEGQRLQDVDIRAYPWDKLPENATVVDIGGGWGHVVKDLAELFPSYIFIVQDLQCVVDTAQAMWKEDAARTDKITNVSFQAHNYFDRQPVEGADVYYMRHTVHSNPDKEAIALLSAIVPAMKPGARILVSEYLAPGEEDVASFAKLDFKPMRQMDIMALALCNSGERTKEEYARLFLEASPKLVLKNTYQVPDDPTSCMFEAVYEE
ncbi:S-adenosyl-L-methionine-dependent methyltransferase [Cercophora newfieldiana]|uniref:S-adenosyl-L-methionine-dependent methyltransferase n=1 Tax=Cercophora newfieldiana TaxID=92897 RepID=A0AA40CUJ4_9PEZI|nr:S-adenosyl-L-methionine-dependent methyltransferase [Cercophora newfieldiana]